MLLHKQCRGFYCCSKRVVNARSVFQEHHLVALVFAAALCTGTNPTACTFEQAGEVTQFPLRAKRMLLSRPVRADTFEGHCHCRMRWKGWYSAMGHANCGTTRAASEYHKDYGPPNNGDFVEPVKSDFVEPVKSNQHYFLLTCTYYTTVFLLTTMLYISRIVIVREKMGVISSRGGVVSSYIDTSDCGVIPS